MKYKEAKYEVITSAYANEFRSALKGIPASRDLLSKAVSDNGMSFLPEPVENRLRAFLKENSIFRSLASVFTSYDGSHTINTFTYNDYAEFIPEGEEIPIKKPGEDFDRLEVQSHKLAVFYKLPLEFVHDSGFCTEDYIAKRTAKNVANAENKAFLLGDGETDIPCMKIVKMFGGNSIAVYRDDNEKQKRTAHKLLKQDRVNFICKADYTIGSEIYKVVTTIIDKVKAEDDFEKLRRKKGCYVK